MKKSLLVATMLVSAALGFGSANKAVAANYTIDGTTNTSGTANGENATQLIIDGTSLPLEGSWNALNGDKVTMSGGTLEVSGYDGSEVTSGLIEATGGSIHLLDGVLTLGADSSMSSDSAIYAYDGAEIRLTGGTLRSYMSAMTFDDDGANINVVDDTTFGYTGWTGNSIVDLTIGEGVTFTDNAYQINLHGALNNNGTFTINGPGKFGVQSFGQDLVNDGVINGDGCLTVGGEFVNNGTIDGIKLRMIENYHGEGNLITDADDITNLTLDNMSKVTLTGGTLTTDINNVVYNAGEENEEVHVGTTIIDGAVAIADGVKVDNYITIVDKRTADPSFVGVLSTNAENLGNTVTNDGQLYLYGTIDGDTTGVLSHEITGDGSTIIKGDIASLALIDTFRISITDGNSLEIAASNVGSEVVALNNTGELILHGGLTPDGTPTAGSADFTSSVDGEGAIYISDGLDLTLTGDGTLSNVVIEDTDTGLNDGAGYGGGILRADLSKISGTIQNDGTLYANGLLGTDIHGNGGTVLTDELSVLADRVIDGTLNMNGQVINMQNAELVTEMPIHVYPDSSYSFDTLSVGSLKGEGSLKIDASMVDGSSDVIEITDGSANNANLTLTSINVVETPDVESGVHNDFITYLTGKTNNIASGVDVALGTIASDNHKYVFTQGTNAGQLNVTVSDAPATLAEFIQGTVEEDYNDNPPAITYNSYSLVGDLEVSEDLGAMGTGEPEPTGGYESPLNLYLNGHDLTAKLDEAGNKQYSGATVSDGYTLNVDGYSDDKNGTISGFTTAFTVEEGGELNIEDVTLTGNGTDIANSGEVNVNYDVVVDTITGNGVTTLVGDDAELTVTTALQQEAVYNGGTLILGDSESETPMVLETSIQNRQTGGGWFPQYDGGETIIAGNVDATNAEIRQYFTVAEDAKLTIDPDNIGFGSTQITVEEDGALNFVGDGTLAYGITISGAGDTIIAEGSNVNNNANIGTYLAIEEDASFTSGANNLNNVKGDIENDGDLTINANGGWGTTNYSKGILGDGTTTFNGNINSSAEIEQDEVVIASGTFTNNDEIYADVTNNGTFNNNDYIDGDIDNYGTFTNNGSIENDNYDDGSYVTNYGTFNNGNNGSISGIVYNKEGATLTGNGTMTHLSNEEGATASIGAGSVEESIANSGDLTLNGTTSSPFGPQPAPSVITANITGIPDAPVGDLTMTGNVIIGEDVSIDQDEINIGGNGGGFGFNSTNVENQGDVTANTINVNGNGFGTTTFTNEHGASIIADEINASASGFGRVEITNYDNIGDEEHQATINLGDNTSLTLSEGSDTYADVNLNGSGSGWFIQDPALSLSSGSDLIGDITADNADISITTGSTITGDVDAEDSEISMSNGASINGDVTAEDGTEISMVSGANINGDVSLEDSSLDMGVGSHIEGDTTLDNSDISMTTGASIGGDLVADESVLNFSSTEDNDFSLDAAIGGVVRGSEYVDPEDPESGYTDGSYIVNTSSPEGSDSAVIIDKELLGATEVNAEGNLILDMEDRDSTSDLIGDALVNLDENASMTIDTIADEFTVDNNIAGSEGSEVVLEGNSGEPESASETGTQFSIADGTTIADTNLDLVSGELLLPDDSMLNENGSTLIIGGSSVDPETGDKISGGTLNTIDGSTKPFETPVAFENEAQVKVDVNAKTKTADHFDNIKQSADDTAILTDVDLQDLNKIVKHTTKVNLSDATGISNLTIGKDLLNKTFTEMTPIRKMTASFDESGMMTILPSSGNNNNWKEYNPAILAAPIAAQFGGFLTQLNSYDQAFANMDMYMLMTKQQRQALKFRNKIATSQGVVAFDPTNGPNDHAAGWFRPFASFEKANLHHGPNVENTAYGSYFGGDSSMKDLGHGWDGMWGAYVGYNGSHQSYTDTGIYQNGGTLGLVGMAYKDNFFIGGTINTGASVGEASTTFGNENFTMLMAGAAIRTGYNWELANGKFIIQPNFQTSYSFVNTFDYTNAAGVNINSDPLHAITVEPGIKFIGNLKHGWQPYAGVNLVYTIMDRSDVMANDIALPNIAINPFVKYGIGVRKTWGDRFTGFFQTFFMNGGRNGVGLQAGFRFAIGKDGSNNISGKTPELKQTKITLNNKK